MQISSRFREALDYAAVLHADQRRKISGEPYLAHLMAVASLVMEYDGTEDEAVAALLHDAAEDQGGKATLEEIARRFGATVAAIVEDCSDTVVTPKPPWRERKEAFIARLRRASDSVRLVSAADKLHNARSIIREYRRHGESIWKRFRGDRDGTLRYYRAIVQTLQEVGDNSLVEELRRTVEEMESIADAGNPSRI